MTARAQGLSATEFDYLLPPELIAQEPAPVRDSAWLLHLDRATSSCSHRHVTDLPDLLTPGDLLVVNDSKVFPARLLGRREPSGGRVECLLLARIDDQAMGRSCASGSEAQGGEPSRFRRG